MRSIYPPQRWALKLLGRILPRQSTVVCDGAVPSVHRNFAAAAAAATSRQKKAGGGIVVDPSSSRTSSSTSPPSSTSTTHQQPPLQEPDLATPEEMGWGGGERTTPNNREFARRLILPPTPQLLARTNGFSDSSSSNEGSNEAAFALSDHPLLYDAAHHTKQLQHTIPTLPRHWRGYEPATPLWNHLAALISVTGRPLSVADYMRLCLTHPEYGYYTTNQHSTSSSSTAALGGTMANNDDGWDDFDDYATNEDLTSRQKDKNLNRYMIGRDFVTAPEISQVFGECLAVWFRTQWDRYRKLQPIAQDRNSAMSSLAWQFVECGPGTGTLMVDLVRASIQLEFGNHCQAIHLIETSPILRELQRETLQRELTSVVTLQFEPNTDTTTTTGTTTATGTIRVVWHDTFLDFVQWQQQQQQQHSFQDNGRKTKCPVTFVVCQEFVDALPVYSFQKTSDGWRERLVDLAMAEEIDVDDEEDDNDNNKAMARPSQTNGSDQVVEGNNGAAEGANTTPTFAPDKKPRLRLVLAPELTPPVKTLLHVNENGWIPGEDPTSNVGCIVEVNPEGVLLVQDIAQVVSESGGAALIVDYGHEGSTDSVRAFARHRQVPFVSQPGLVDVTADVDFAALRSAVNHKQLAGSAVQAHGPVSQGEFLMAMGLQERVLSVIENDATTDENAENLYQAMIRLASHNEMGEKFKVLAIAPTCNAGKSSPPPGFDR